MILAAVGVTFLSHNTIQTHATPPFLSVQHSPWMLVMSDDDRSYHFNKRPDQTYVSKSFNDVLTGIKLRIASKVIDHEEGLHFAMVGNEITLRATPKGRLEVKATFLEDTRRITTLTIQKFNAISGPSGKHHFSFVGEEINTLLTFILGIKTLSLEGGKKLHLSDSQLREVILNDRQAKELFSENEELFVKIAQSEHLKKDLVAIGFRRKQLEHFEKLLTDQRYFDEELARLSTTPEALWQKFFEGNTWIFGYGLSYQFLSGLDGRKLEQVVRGHDLGGSGKRVDALMKTQAVINSLCFVEIKRHDAPLLTATAYRTDAWPPSSELSGGVAQVQASVQSALENIGQRVSLRQQDGSPTGETLFNFEPRSFLVIGSLNEFVTANGINEPKFGSFEIYRRHISRPEILTFDELLHRARFIVEHDELKSGD